MPKQKTLGDLVDALHAKREEIRDVNIELKELKEEQAALEEEYLAAAEEHGLTQVRGAMATATVKRAWVPHVTDWNAFYRFIARKKAYHLLERRPSVVAWREEVELRGNKPVPGVEAYEKKTVGLLSTN